jgi:hypothetical protein
MARCEGKFPPSPLFPKNGLKHGTNQQNQSLMADSGWNSVPTQSRNKLLILLYCSVFQPIFGKYQGGREY